MYFKNCFLFTNVVFLVNLYNPVAVSWIKPTDGPPFWGLTICFPTDEIICNSIWVTILWGTWRFISSPSKSAL